LFVGGLWITISLGLANDSPPTESGQWWQYRGNQQLSGRSKIKRRIDKPTVSWAYPLAGRETLLDAATGALKWRFPMPDESPTFPAVADIDGDGRDECVFTMGNIVYAVGAAKASPVLPPAGRIHWKLDLPGTAGPAAIADAEGNGVAQIIVACSDGHVYGIGPARSPSPLRH